MFGSGLLEWLGRCRVYLQMSIMLDDVCLVDGMSRQFGAVNQLEPHPHSLLATSRAATLCLSTQDPWPPIEVIGDKG